MPQVNAKNERLKMRYAEELKRYDGLQETTIDPKLRAIKCYEKFTEFVDLESFDYDLAIKFVDAVRKQVISAQTKLTTVRHVKAFFEYMALEGLLKKKHARKAVNAIRLSERDRRAGQGRKPVKFHSAQQYKDAITTMPKGTPIERRDRAMVAFLLLTGIRDGALITLNLEHVDLANKRVTQDPNEVHTKGGKMIITTFLPVGEEIIQEIAEYITYLRNELGFTDKDPLFPSPEQSHDENDRFVYNTLSKSKWANPQPVRDVIKAAFQAIGLPYVKPHSIRHTLTALSYELGVPPEEFKALSQNLGHDDVSTTYNHYGMLSPERQHAKILGLHEKIKPNNDDDRPATVGDMKAFFLEARKQGVL